VCPNCLATQEIHHPSLHDDFCNLIHHHWRFLVHIQLHMSWSAFGFQVTIILRHICRFADNTRNMVLWVFGYGSLVWKAGFEYDERIIGYVKGYRRVFYQGNTILTSWFWAKQIWFITRWHLHRNHRAVYLLRTNIYMHSC
jgi:hypothetical protein